MVMEIEKTPLWADIRKVFKSGTKEVKYEYIGKIHTEKEDFDIMKIVTIDTIRDYTNNIGDQIIIEFLMPLGEYVKRFYPNRVNLEVSITTKLISETGDAYPKNPKIETERYKAIFLPNENMVFKTSEYDTYSLNDLNLMQVLTVKLQLMNRSLEPLRIKTVGGVFKNVTQKDVIHSLLVGESNKVLVDGKPSIDGMDLMPPDNSETQAHVIIPHGTLLTSIPTFLQEKMNGVYTSGIGTFLQTYAKRRTWFVYSLFNTDRFQKENVPKIIFYSIPRTRFPAIERTYRKEADITHILLTSGKGYQDSADTDFMNSGNGFRMADARSFMKKPIEMKPDGPVGNRKRLNHEVAVSDRSDGLNYAPVVDRDISSNPYAQYSRVLQSKGARIDVVWQNADPREIYPGMPCKYVYLEKDEVKEQYGIILFNHILVQLDGTGVAAKTHTTTCQMTLYTSGIVEPT